ncbi:hypothetical protein KO465_09645 [Candidatus Micrarchaeota archaeon]|jgi:hypothetical protein|nr:hypothetical protein [Candidatus Micrarchaeota archaeon]
MARNKSRYQLVPQLKPFMKLHGADIHVEVKGPRKLDVTLNVFAELNLKVCIDLDQYETLKLSYKNFETGECGEECFQREPKRKLILSGIDYFWSKAACSLEFYKRPMVQKKAEIIKTCLVATVKNIFDEKTLPVQNFEKKQLTELEEIALGIKVPKPTLVKEAPPKEAQKPAVSVGVQINSVEKKYLKEIIRTAFETGCDVSCTDKKFIITDKDDPRKNLISIYPCAPEDSTSIQIHWDFKEWNITIGEIKVQDSREKILKKLGSFFPETSNSLGSISIKMKKYVRAIASGELNEEDETYQNCKEILTDMEIEKNAIEKAKRVEEGRVLFEDSGPLTLEELERVAEYLGLGASLKNKSLNIYQTHVINRFPVQNVIEINKPDDPKSEIVFVCVGSSQVEGKINAVCSFDQYQIAGSKFERVMEIIDEKIDCSSNENFKKLKDPLRRYLETQKDSVSLTDFYFDELSRILRGLVESDNGLKIDHDYVERNEWKQIILRVNDNGDRSTFQIYRGAYPTIVRISKGKNGYCVFEAKKGQEINTGEISNHLKVFENDDYGHIPEAIMDYLIHCR